MVDKRVGFTTTKFSQNCAECGEQLSRGDTAGFDNNTGDWLCSAHAVELAELIGQPVPKFLNKSSPAQTRGERSDGNDTSGAKNTVPSLAGLRQQKSGSAKASPRLNAGNESDSRMVSSFDAQKQLKQIEDEALDHISDHLDAFERAIGERFQRLEQELSRKADLAASEITMAELRLSNAVRATMDAHIGQMMKRVEEQVSGYVMALGTLEFRLKEHVATIESIRDKAPAPIITLPMLEVES